MGVIGEQQPQRVPAGWQVQLGAGLALAEVLVRGREGDGRGVVARQRRVDQDVVVARLLVGIAGWDDAHAAHAELDPERRAHAVAVLHVAEVHGDRLAQVYCGALRRVGQPALALQRVDGQRLGHRHRRRQACKTGQPAAEERKSP